MAGISGLDNMMAALSAGQTVRADWTKNFNPTTAAVANECHTLFRGGGNPAADALFDTGANLTFIPVTDQTANAASIQHGGNVSPAYKFITNGQAFTAAATVAPSQVVLIDVVGYYRVTTVTTATAQATTNTLSAFSTFTADAGTDICTHSNINLMPYTRVQFTTTTTLPAGLSLATDYYIIKITDTTFKVASSYANAVAGTAIDITSAGTGTHTINTLLPRYTNGAGLNAIIFNPAATALGAATPNMSLVYTNSAQTGSRATPTLPALPVGKTAASNSLIIYTGATAAGKYNFAMPRASGDAGIAKIDSIQNSVSYVSGSYTVALYKELWRGPITTLGVAAERNTINEIPSMPRVYDGAALYLLTIAGANIPTNSTITGYHDFIWN
jgi:hypothetical protein